MKKNEGVLAVILARVGSKRLKKKVIKQINNKTILDFFIERLKNCKNIDKIVLASSTLRENDSIERIAKKNDIPIFRGPENDVLLRVCKLLRKEKDFNYIVRANADCPLFMPTVVDQDLKLFKKKKYEMYSPFHNNKYPFGFGFVIYRRNLLFKILKKTKNKIYREHIENYCFDHPDKVNFYTTKISKNNRFFFPNLSLTLDTMKDYKKIIFLEKKLRKIKLKDQPQKLIGLFK